MSRKPSPELTPNMRAALAFVEERISVSGKMPTLREVADLLGFSSTATAAGVLKSLKVRGLLRRPRWSRKAKIPGQKRKPQ